MTPAQRVAQAIYRRLGLAEEPGAFAARLQSCRAEGRLEPDKDDAAVARAAAAEWVAAHAEAVSVEAVARQLLQPGWSSGARQR